MNEQVANAPIRIELRRLRASSVELNERFSNTIGIMKIIQYVIAGAVTLASTCFGAHAQAGNSIRNIDFRNFTYEPSCSSTKATVRDGKFDNTDPDERV